MTISKLSFGPVPDRGGQCRRSSVGWWPADRTGRSANMIELGVTPVKVSVSPCSVAPRELSTNSEGTISGLAGADGVPIVFMDDGAAAV